MIRGVNYERIFWSSCRRSYTESFVNGERSERNNEIASVEGQVSGGD